MSTLSNMRASTLYEYYTSLGMPLPTIEERSYLYEALGLGAASSYTGSADQNTRLLSILQGEPNDNQPPAMDDPRAVIEQHRDLFESVTIAQVLEAFDYGMNVIPVELGSVLSAYGLGWDTVAEGRAFFAQFPASATLYDTLLDLIDTVPAPTPETPPFEPPPPLDSGPAFDLPEMIDWSQDSGATGSQPGAYTSPTFSIDSATGNWSVKGTTSEFLDRIPQADREFYAGSGFDMLSSVASQGLTNVLLEHARSVLPDHIVEVVEQAETARSLRDLMNDWVHDIFKGLEEGFQAIASPGNSGWDDSVLWDRSTQFRGDLETLLTEKIGSDLGSNARGFADLIIGKARIIIQKSDVTFAVEEVSAIPTFDVQGDHRVGVLAASEGDSLRGGARGDLLVGQDGDDVLRGNAGGDHLIGGGGRDAIWGEAGDDMLVGGDGIDTAVFTGRFADHALSWIEGGLLVHDLSGREGTDRLEQLERLQFSDRHLALDLDGNAGKVAAILATVFGAESLSNKVYAGIGLHHMDAGMSFEELITYALAATDARSHEEIVSRLYYNVLGIEPDRSAAQPYIDLLDQGMAPGSLAALAAAYATVDFPVIVPDIRALEYEPLG